jgi:hypothetical protein
MFARMQAQQQTRPQNDYRVWWDEVIVCDFCWILRLIEMLTSCFNQRTLAQHNKETLFKEKNIKLEFSAATNYIIKLFDLKERWEIYANFNETFNICINFPLRFYNNYICISKAMWFLSFLYTMFFSSPNKVINFREFTSSRYMVGGNTLQLLISSIEGAP